MQIAYRNGIHLPQPDVWLDPHTAQNFAVVTHAHADHMKCHERVWSTPATAAMMRLRGARSCCFEAAPFGESKTIGDAQFTLFPAGHVLGSAQVLVERNGVRLLYSGDFKMSSSLSAEAIEVPRADILIMETTFGLQRYRFPHRDEVLDSIKGFCRKTLEKGEAPVLLCYSLGKGQEVLAGLTELEFPIYLHAAHFEMASLYQEWGVRFPPFRRYRPGQRLDGVLLCAGGCRRGRWFGELQTQQQVRTAYISGWALDHGAKWRFHTDAAFPLSDHADYDELLQYVYLSGAQKVYTVHGFAGEFAADLRELGFDAQPLRSESISHSTAGRRSTRQVAATRLEAPQPALSQPALFSSLD